MGLRIPPPNTPLVDQRGKVDPAWYRYFVSLNTQTDEAEAGEVATPSAGGLAGGGVVADGVTLSILDNGVSDAKIRQSMGCSVIGRYEDGAGNVADIVASANHRVLSREDDMLAFRNVINGVSIGSTAAAPLVRFDALESTDTPAASTATVTHSLSIQTGSGTMYLLLSNAP